MESSTAPRGVMPAPLIMRWATGTRISTGLSDDFRIQRRHAFQRRPHRPRL